MPLLPDEPLPEIALEESTEGALLRLTWDVVRELDLPGIAVANRVIRRVGRFDNLDFPAVVVRFFDESINPREGTNESDDLHFAYMVSIVAANAEQAVGESKLGTLLAWRQTVRRAFLNHVSFTGIASPTLPGHVRTVVATVRPGQAYVDEALRASYDAQYLLIDYFVREARQSGA